MRVRRPLSDTGLGADSKLGPGRLCCMCITTKYVTPDLTSVTQPVLQVRKAVLPVSMAWESLSTAATGPVRGTSARRVREIRTTGSTLGGQ